VHKGKYFQKAWFSENIFQNIVDKRKKSCKIWNRCYSSAPYVHAAEKAECYNEEGLLFILSQL